LKGAQGLNDSNDMAELVFTLVMMGLLLVVAIAAVVVFFRVWRKENKGRGRNFFE
jgi:uncharacterized membrane protein HdeD (DUF308 family)